MLFRIIGTKMSDGEARVLAGLWGDMTDKFFRDMCTFTNDNCEGCPYSNLCKGLVDTHGYLEKRAEECSREGSESLEK